MSSGHARHGATSQFLIAELFSLLVMHKLLLYLSLILLRYSNLRANPLLFSLMLRLSDLIANALFAAYLIVLLEVSG